jgi:hypothetical protein
VVPFLDLDMHEIRAPEIVRAEVPEEIVQDRCRHLDPRVAPHKPGRLVAGEDVLFDEHVERHPVLQGAGHPDAHSIDQAAEGRPFLAHGHEDLA